MIAFALGSSQVASSGHDASAVFVTMASTIILLGNSRGKKVVFSSLSTFY